MYSIIVSCLYTWNINLKFIWVSESCIDQQSISKNTHDRNLIISLIFEFKKAIFISIISQYLLAVILLTNVMKYIFENKTYVYSFMIISFTAVCICLAPIKHVMP